LVFFGVLIKIKQTAIEEFDEQSIRAGWKSLVDESSRCRRLHPFGIMNK
jgi:hypothetical protein